MFYVCKIRELAGCKASTEESASHQRDAEYKGWGSGGGGGGGGLGGGHGGGRGGAGESEGGGAFDSQVDCM